MNNDIKEDLFNQEFEDYLNKFIENLINNHPELLKKYEILQIEFDIDGKKKDIYKLASERDIKNMQIESDKNELDFKLSQGKITKEEYKIKMDEINSKLNEQNLLYDDLIFDIINKNDLDSIKKSIETYNLNSIDLSRLATAVNAVAENKINEFRNNNNNFMIDKLSYWNYKYNIISKGLSKAREVETIILNIIENK